MQLITVEKKGHVLWMGLNRPAERNRANVELLIELSDAYTIMEEDPDIRCGVVFAHGKHFTMGLELDSVMKRLRADGRWPIPDGNVNPWDPGFLGRPRTRPVIVAAHGFCFTLGIELMLASEISLAAPGTRFAQAEVRFGIFPIGGGTARWVQSAGRGNGMRYLLTGEVFDAKDALRLGVIQEIVEKDRLLDRAGEFAAMIAANGPLGVRATMESVRIYERDGMNACAQALMPALQDLLRTSDATEGVAAFREGRAPVFQGR